MAVQKVSLEVETREQFGKGHNRRLRVAGRIPANVYGLGLKPFALSVEPQRIEDLLHSGSGRNTILSLSMKGADESRDVMIREIQRDPVHDVLTHIDFFRVDPKRKMQFRVPVNLIGIPLGVRNEGALLDFIHRDVLVNCLPSAIPEHLDGDVNELHVGQHLSIKDLVLPENVEMLDDADMVLAVVAHAKVEEEAPAEVEEDADSEAAPDAEGATPEGGAAAEPSGKDTDS